MNKRIIAVCLIAALVSVTGVLYSFTEHGSAKPLKWKTGVALYSFNHFSFAESLKRADSAGAKYVEGFFFHKLGDDFGGHSIPALSNEEIAKMKTMLSTKGLQMKSLYAGNGKNLKEWLAYFDFAKQTGVEFLNCEPEKKDWNLLDSLAGVYKTQTSRKLTGTDQVLGGGQESRPYTRRPEFSMSETNQPQKSIRIWLVHGIRGSGKI